MDTLLLWHIPLSHYNEKARWALDYKRIAHHRQVLGADYLIRAWRATGRGTLPILFLDGQAIGDSTHVIAALEERYPEPPLYPRDVAARARALDLLRGVRVPEPERRLKQYPHELSGGMRQRVVIAMAMACEPRLLIADEPTTALDVTIQAEILALIDRLKRENHMAVLFVTHDMAVVAQMADRVVVMHRGKIVEEGDVTTIFENPQADYTRMLLAEFLASSILFQSVFFAR